MSTLPPPRLTAGKRRDSGNGNVMGVRCAHKRLQINEFGRFYQILMEKFDIAVTWQFLQPPAIFPAKLYQNRGATVVQKIE